MFAFRSCSSALLADHSAPRRPMQPATRIPRPVASVPRQALHSSSAPGTERVSSPLYYQQVAHYFSRARNSNHSLFSSFSTLSHARKNLTPYVSSTSTLLVRSFAQEVNSTPLLSCACALFCGNVRVGVADLLLPNRMPSRPSPFEPQSATVRKSLASGVARQARMKIAAASRSTRCGQSAPSAKDATGRNALRGAARHGLGEARCLPLRSTVDVSRQWCYTPTRLQIVTEEKKCVDSPI
jgi:hypothetical protein